MTKYESLIKKCKPKMLEAMRKLATELNLDVNEVWENEGDDFSISFMVEREDGTKLDVSFSIWDSGDADDGIYGEHGNFIFNIVEEGGRIVGSCIPENYSDKVWVDYKDSKEWTRRLEAMIDGLPDAISIVEKWKGE